MQPHAEQRELVEASKPPKRPRHVILGILAGAAIAYAIGVVLVLVINSSSLTGRPDDVFTYIFGLPTLIGIAGGVLGALISVLSYAEEEDAAIVEEDAEGHLVVVHPSEAHHA